MSKTNEAPLPLFDNLEHLKRDALNENLGSLPTKALNDLKQGFEFLYAYRGSQATFNSYRREVERLLQWSWHVALKPLKKLTRDDIEAYIYFCQSPPKAWIGTKNAARFVVTEGMRVANSEWRPFVATVSKKAHRDGHAPDVKKYAMSQNALQAVFAILGSFFTYLLHEEYVEINPVAQIRQKSKFLRKYQKNAPIRRLSELQWSYVIETAEQLAQMEPHAHERTLFVMTALYSMYLRVSELASNERWEAQMGHFFQDIDGNWWFKTVGKGNKERDISVSDSMLEALKRYRLFLEMSALPSPGETTPLILKINGKGAVTATRQIRRIVQACFDATIERLRTDDFKDEADQLASATVHWLRHTGISDDVKHRPREHVRDDAGHGSSAITDRYIDVERRARHDSAKKKQIDPNE